MRNLLIVGLVNVVITLCVIFGVRTVKVNEELNTSLTEVEVKYDSLVEIDKHRTQNIRALLRESDSLHIVLMELQDKVLILNKNK